MRWQGREPGVDAAPAGRLWLSRLLAGADLHPPGMPPSALLVVARLDDPLPGRIAHSLHDARPSVEWEQAVRSRLADLWQRAARPVAGVVPPGAAAVLFAERAELLACLAVVAVSAHAAASGGTALPPGSSVAWWQGVAQQQPSRATLFALLQQAPQLLPAVMAHLSSWGKAEAVLASLAPREAIWLVRAVGEAHALPLEQALFAAAPSTGPVPAPGKAAAVAEGTRQSQAGVTVSPTFRAPWAPLLVRRGLRPPRLAEPAHRLLLGLLLALRLEPALVRSERFLQALRAWWAAGAFEDEAEPVTQAAIGHSEQAPQSVERREGAIALESTSAEYAASGKAYEAAQNPHTRQKRSPAGDRLEPVAEEGAVEAPAVDQTPPEATPLPVPIPTRLGGLLYLVNLLTRLELIDRCREVLGPWALLELAGRDLLSDALPGLAEDLIWPLLAELDGREPGTLPGEALPDWVMPTVQTWLQRALPDGPEWLLVDAQLYVTASHLDLVMDLNAIRLDVRMAGLDADPGWVPDLGRVIRFHFV